MKSSIILGVMLFWCGHADAFEVVVGGSGDSSDAKPKADAFSRSFYCDSLLSNREGKIVREAASPEAWPEVVSIGRQVQHFCNGVVVDDKWVMTLDFCINGDGSSDEADPLQIWNISSLDTTQMLTSKRVVIGPGNGSTPGYRAALIELSESIPAARPAWLSDHRSDAALLRPGACAVVVGQGLLADGPTSNNLDVVRQVALPIVDPADCRLAYGERVDTDSVCTGYAGGGMDACAGFGGAPLFGFTSAGPRVLGLVGWGEGCARPLKYTVHLRASALATWVEETIRPAARSSQDSDEVPGTSR